MIKIIKKIQCVAKGFLARNAFYQEMKDKQYYPKNTDLKKKYIGYKLSLIGKRWREEMAKDREERLNKV